MSRKPKKPRENSAVAPAARARAGGSLLSKLGYASFAVLGVTALFLQQASARALPHGSLIAFGSTLVSAISLLGLFGLLSVEEGAGPAATSEAGFGRLAGEHWLVSLRVTVPLSVVLLVGGIAGFGYPGLPPTIVCALVALLPSAARRPGLLLGVLVSLLYLPLLGVSALWDPWETHYGEVAREILSRNDWISLWWAQDGWFWSKPILIFWSEALTMSALGVDPSPDANPLHPEWAMRLPIFAMSLAALLAVYGLVRRLFGPRAGLLAGLAVATAPHFFLLAHQSITDMPLVACLTVSLCFLMAALAEDPEREAAVHAFGPLRVSARTAAVFALILLVLPQATYLLTRNATLDDRFALVLHEDAFLHGSAGNAGVSGNAEHRLVHPDVRWPLGAALGLDARSPLQRVDLAQPAFQGGLWLVLLAIAGFFVARERKAQGLSMVGFYVTCALGLMAKGLPALALPGLVALLYLVGSGRFGALFRGELRIGLGVLIVVLVGVPWYLAMFVRHGKGFLDRLLIHDHINRLASGVHGDNGSLQYFLAQLGYALFPWVALAPAAVAGFFWYRRSSDAKDPMRRSREETLVFLALWAVSAFALFSAMVTKFHHYIFPAVPPIAILSGILLDRLWGEAAVQAPRRLRALGTFAAVASGPILALAVAGHAGDVRGRIPARVPEAERLDWVVRHPWPEAATIGLFAAGSALAVFAFFVLKRTSSAERSAFAEPRRLGLSVAMLAGAAVLGFVGRDMSWVTPARPQGYERLSHLFVYNYGRPWPAHFDYRPILVGFAVVATAVAVLAAGKRLQPVMARAFLGLAISFTAWGVNVYMFDLADHWSIRPLVERYYERRSGPEQPIVAWQMNWKGENFYTGNRVHVFAQVDNRAVREWISEHEGTKAFFALERARLRSFRSLVQNREVRELTTERECNKFVLVEVTL